MQKGTESLADALATTSPWARFTFQVEKSEERCTFEKCCLRTQAPHGTASASSVGQSVSVMTGALLFEAMKEEEMAF